MVDKYPDHNLDKRFDWSYYYIDQCHMLCMFLVLSRHYNVQFDKDHTMLYQQVADNYLLHMDRMTRPSII